MALQKTVDKHGMTYVNAYFRAVALEASSRSVSYRIDMYANAPAATSIASRVCIYGHGTIPTEDFETYGLTTVGQEPAGRTLLKGVYEYIKDNHAERVESETGTSVVYPFSNALDV